jgi:hypothetical protein
MFKIIGFAMVVFFSSLAMARTAPEFFATGTVSTAYQTPDDAMPAALANLQRNAQEVCRDKAVVIGGVDSVNAIRVTDVLIQNQYYVLRVKAGFVCEMEYRKRVCTQYGYWHKCCDPMTGECEFY